METLLKFCGENWVLLLLVYLAGIASVFVFVIAAIIYQVTRDVSGSRVRYEANDEDEVSYYDPTRLELQADNKRLLEDLEAEKKFSHDIVTVKNIVLDENLTLATRGVEMEGVIEQLCNMVDKYRNEIYSYEEALVIRLTMLEKLKEENRQLEVLIEMGRENIEGTDLVNERTRELFKNYVISNSEDKNQNIKMENTICVNG